MKHAKNCQCDSCWRKSIVSLIEKSTAEIVKKNPGIVCPFCGTNPSKPARYGMGWKDFCGHEVRRKGLVIGWRKEKGSSLMKCTNSGETKQEFDKNFLKEHRKDLFGLFQSHKQGA